jgi:hypothetical protein
VAAQIELDVQDGDGEVIPVHASIYSQGEENCWSSRSTERRGVSTPHKPGASHLSAATIARDILTHAWRPTARFMSISGSQINGLSFMEQSYAAYGIFFLY